MIKAVILAGKSENELEGKLNKGLININGRPMISYVIDALEESSVIDYITIVGDRNEFENIDAISVDSFIEDRGSMIENLKAGIHHYKNEERVLVVTSDIPLLTKAGVKDFVERALESKADICYPIIERATCEEKYPETKRTYAKLKEGSFTGGNIILINPQIVDRSIKIASQMIEHRKNPMKMSKVLGVTFLIKLLLGKLTIALAENRVASILDIRPKAIICSYPEIGNDVDKPEDVEMAKKYLAK